MLLPRLLVAVQPTMRRRMGLPKTTWRPSRSSAKMLVGAPSAGDGDGLGSGLRTSQIRSAEPTYETASTMMAAAPPANWIRNPASPGPATWAVDLLTSSLELPSTRSLRSIKAGRYDW